MKDDFLIEGFLTPPHPKGLTFFGKSVRLEPLDIENILKIYTMPILLM